jgi:hypothetical protein
METSSAYESTIGRKSRNSSPSIKGAPSFDKKGATRAHNEKEDKDPLLELSKYLRAFREQHAVDKKSGLEKTLRYLRNAVGKLDPSEGNESAPADLLIARLYTLAGKGNGAATSALNAMSRFAARSQTEATSNPESVDYL